MSEIFEGLAVIIIGDAVSEEDTCWPVYQSYKVLVTALEA